MERLDSKNVVEMICHICDDLIANEQKLCELDSVVGDGDHGITISRGFLAVKKEIKESNIARIDRIFLKTGEILSETMGGAIGPIFGGLFSAMGEALEEENFIDSKMMAGMFKKALEEVMLIGNAKPGDRTLVDALLPAKEAAEAKVGEGASLSQILNTAADAAKAGAEATKNMVAKKGRAKFLQEKSLGYQDAGATSLYLAIAAMAAYCKTK
jgi:dihydroxyacetone kinase phosphoprotein-dependent L subunit